MKIKAKRNTQDSAGKDIQVGKTYTAGKDISERDAKYLVSIGKASIVKSGGGSKKDAGNDAKKDDGNDAKKGEK
jgi:hypothetical protein